MRDDRAEKIGNSKLMGFAADEWMPTRYETETKFVDGKIAFSVSLLGKLWLFVLKFATRRSHHPRHIVMTTETTSRAQKGNFGDRSR